MNSMCLQLMGLFYFYLFTFLCKKNYIKILAVAKGLEATSKSGSIIWLLEIRKVI